MASVRKEARAGYTLRQMSAQEPVPGDVLAGRYRLSGLLGRGGMGSVWRAEHLSLGSPVAVKLIHARSAHAPEAQARFLREAQSAAALRGPHVVQVLDFGVEQGVPFIVMELLEGESLADRIARTGALSAQATARIVTHVARAIQKTHEAGIVHRDLKPDNVFLVENADDELAKVLDFGIAKTAEGLGQAGVETHTGTMLGSPHYMSPEQARGTRAVDHRSDLWALGVIGFQCLTGRRPFDGNVLGDLVLRICAEPPPVPSALAHVPPGFDAWFARAVERDPGRRFQSAWEMAEELRRVAGLAASLTEGPVSLPPATTAGQLSALPPRPTSSHGAIVLVLGLLALLGAAALAGVLLLVLGGRDRAPPTAPSAPPAAPVAVAGAAAQEEPEAAPPASAMPAPKLATARTPARGSHTATAPPDALSKVQAAEAKVKAAQQKVKEAEEKV
jgi:eukaryotic-like serine/threonine-protein kinase